MHVDLGELRQGLPRVGLHIAALGQRGRGRGRLLAGIDGLRMAVVERASHDVRGLPGKHGAHGIHEVVVRCGLRVREPGRDKVVREVRSLKKS